MKKIILPMVMIFTMVMYPQMKKNGTIYDQHPAISVVEEMQQAFVAGDSAKVASYLTGDFKMYDGFNSNPDYEGRTRDQFLNSIKGWQKYTDYMSLERFPGAYPDALEYKKDESGLWVQTWDMLKGMDKETGVKLNMPVHRLYKMDDNNKIQMLITYDDNAVWMKNREAFNPRTNGTIYNQHENINTVRKMVGALENGDVDKGFSYFTDDARFTSLDMKEGEFRTTKDEKEHFNEFLKGYDIEGMDMRGYPDYLEYEIGKSKLVQSWWDFRIKRKSDGKKYKIPIFFIHYFNDDGKITRETGYYTLNSMKE
ncbi:nuclear transport factor 2 family protein [Mangrovimonas futianensis]|uniref:nuclear transport factor 2 family protein n=1 Tax=Mangrovimonas futianensis TaxID=2895523 RepID=UPI001E545B1B|nr:nuclear transport factor 2 family protein [Mangrovimonas futianensis]MCF1423013.1 nuclear transport factor 2 family protein [Mangrovimonas futianensis]